MKVIRLIKEVAEHHGFDHLLNGEKGTEIKKALEHMYKKGFKCGYKAAEEDLAEYDDDDDDDDSFFNERMSERGGRSGNNGGSYSERRGGGRGRSRRSNGQYM